MLLPRFSRRHNLALQRLNHRGLVIRANDSGFVSQADMGGGCHGRQAWPGADRAWGADAAFLLNYRIWINSHDVIRKMRTENRGDGT